MRNKLLFLLTFIMFNVGLANADDLRSFYFVGFYSSGDDLFINIEFDLDTIGEPGQLSSMEYVRYPIDDWFIGSGNSTHYFGDDGRQGYITIYNDVYWYNSTSKSDVYFVEVANTRLIIRDYSATMLNSTRLFGEESVLTSNPSNQYHAVFETHSSSSWIEIDWHVAEKLSNPVVDRIDLSRVFGVQSNQSFKVDFKAVRNNGAPFLGVVATGFQHCVDLSTNHSSLKVDPTFVCLQNGVAPQKDITITGPGAENAKLIASYRGIRGESNTFKVTDPQVVTSKLLVDVRYDSTLRAFQSFSGEVSLKDANGAVVKQSVQNSNGYYEFTGLKPGSYNLWAVEGSGEWRSPENHPFIVSAGHTNRTEFRTLLVKDVGKPPVLIIPGFAGSTVKGFLKYDEFDVTAHLPEERALASELRILNFSPFDSAGPINGGGFSNLDTELSNNGFNVITVPWDWRVSISEDVYDNAWRVYLLEAIDSAKDPNGDGVDDFDQVDIVAHSMGGLLVRSYIQSNSYRFRNDIRRFAMVGTPNEGSAKAYYMVQGGNPKLSDDGDSGKCSGNPFRINPACFFSRTTDRLYRALNDGESPFEKTFFRTDYSKAKSEKDLVEFYADYVPAGLQLQPTFDALYSFGTSPRQLTVKPNQFLLDLNSNDKKTRMSPFSEACTNTDKVGTEIFASANVKTLENIMVTLPVNGSIEYPDGRPVNTPIDIYDRGDGTVLTSSAVGGGLNVDTTISESYGEHSRLMGSYKTEIRNFLQQECP